MLKGCHINCKGRESVVEIRDKEFDVSNEVGEGTGDFKSVGVDGMY